MFWLSPAWQKVLELTFDGTVSQCALMAQTVVSRLDECCGFNCTEREASYETPMHSCRVWSDVSRIFFHKSLLECWSVGKWLHEKFQLQYCKQPLGDAKNKAKSKLHMAVQQEYTKHTSQAMSVPSRYITFSPLHSNKVNIVASAFYCKHADEKQKWSHSVRTSRQGSCFDRW